MIRYTKVFKVYVIHRVKHRKSLIISICWFL